MSVISATWAAFPLKTFLQTASNMDEWYGSASCFHHDVWSLNMTIKWQYILNSDIVGVLRRILYRKITVESYYPSTGWIVWTDYHQNMWLESTSGRTPIWWLESHWSSLTCHHILRYHFGSLGESCLAFYGLECASIIGVRFTSLNRVAHTHNFFVKRATRD